MGLIDLALAKQYLDVIHAADDAKLQMLLDGAIDEAAQYINQSPLDIMPEGGRLPGGFILGVMLLLQAAYQASPDDAEKLRRAAEIKLTPYRIGWGV